MMFKTHIAMALFAGLGILNVLNLENKIMFVIAVLAGASVVDIDLKTSKVGRKAKPVSTLFQFIFSHRGFFHTVFAGLILTVPILIISKIGLAFGFFAGYLSHIIIDMFNPKGVRPFSPFFQLSLRGPIPVGSLREYTLLAVLVFIDALVLLKFTL